MRRALLVGFIVLVAPAPAAADDVSFGADLSTAKPDSFLTATCGQPPPGYSDPVGSPSCMFSFAGVGSAATLVAPATGTVTRIRVSTGAVTGPMRVNVIRTQSRKTTRFPQRAGPFLQVYGPEFTPAPNSITTLDVNLPMTIDPTPPSGDFTTVQNVDALALEVESPTTPIPIYRDGKSATLAIYPGPTGAGVQAGSQTPLMSRTATGYQVLLNAEMQTAAPVPISQDDIDLGIYGLPPVEDGGGTAPTKKPSTTKQRALLSLRKTRIKVTRNVAAIPVRCAHATCSGTVELRRAKGKAITLGRKSFKFKSGAAGTVKLRLNASGGKLLKTSRQAFVRLRTTLAGTTTSKNVTLRR